MCVGVLDWSWCPAAGVFAGNANKYLRDSGWDVEFVKNRDGKIVSASFQRSKEEVEQA
jgi:hypothetical protein